jgi:hypothetical protein
MALLVAVVMPVVVAHAHLLAHLVTMMDRMVRRAMVVGVGGQRRHEGGAENEEAEEARTRSGGAVGGWGRHADLS